MAANRGDSLLASIRKTFQRGGLLGFYQGLIPWAWIEASTKGAVLLFVASEVEYRTLAAGANAPIASVIGGMSGGIAQAYATMGFCSMLKYKFKFFFFFFLFSFSFLFLKKEKLR